jgi:O-acetyl-ADP-ribose deacetylase (regulator of RNase III)
MENKKSPPPLVPDFGEPEGYLKIYLRDENSAAVESWNAAFHDTRLSEYLREKNMRIDFDIARGSVLNLTENIDVLVSPCYSNGFMKHGICNKYINSFGARIESDIQKQISQKYHGILPIGRAIMMSMSKYSDSFRFLAISPISTVEGSNDPFSVFLSFKAILEVCEAYNSSRKDQKITSIACPALGNSEYFRSALQMRVAIDTLYGRGFVGKSNSEQKELHTLLTTIKKPFSISALYTP